jgi:hypothetical protein
MESWSSGFGDPHVIDWGQRCLVDAVCLSQGSA